MNRRISMTLVSVLALLALAGLAAAGPLDPPAGPVTSTYKTLSEVQPRTAINAVNTPGDNDATPSIFKISQPGAYYLTGNISGLPGKHGIEITVNNVSIDLNGFTVSGVPGSLTGIFYSSAAVTGAGLEISNGVVRDWGGAGINLGANITLSSVVRNVRAINNAGPGVRVGFDSLVVDVLAANSGAEGILAAQNCTIQNCHARSNAGPGISVSQGCTVDHCVAATGASHGIVAASGVIVSDCTATSNTGTGFQILETSIALRCISSANNAYGFQVGSSSSLTDCAAVGNALSAARVTGAGAAIRRCSFSGVNGFPVVALDAVSTARITDNILTFGSYAVSGPGATDALVTSNQCNNQSTGAFTLGASCQIGPVVTAGGTIISTSPYANFVH